MKRIEIEKFGLVQMESNCLAETNGGFLPFIALIIEVACYAGAGDIMLNFNAYADAIDTKTHNKMTSGSW